MGLASFCAIVTVLCIRALLRAGGHERIPETDSPAEKPNGELIPALIAWRKNHSC